MIVRLTTVLDCVALVLDFSSFWKETLAAFSATTTKNSCAVFSSHTCTESELALAAALRWLVSPLAHNVKIKYY